MTRMRYGHEGQARILVADWDQTNGMALSAILQTKGYGVTTAFNGKEAVAKAASFIPDLLVTEPYLSHLSGIDAATQITSQLPDCRVLFLSSHMSSVEIAKAAPKHLVYSFASKPLHLLDLLNAVAYMLPAKRPMVDRAWKDGAYRTVGSVWTTTLAATIAFDQRTTAAR